MAIIDKRELHRLNLMFKACGPLFIALGDETRQKLVMDIADAGAEEMNVTNLAAKTHLSRPAISHHLKVLKDCGLVKSVKNGTQIFYRLNLKDNLEELSELISSIKKVMDKIASVEKRKADGA